MMRSLHAFLRREDGATAVEFALILPVLLAILFGIICFGQYFAIASSLQQLAAESARRSVLGLSQAEREGLALGFLADAQTRFPILSSDKIQPPDVQTVAGPGIQVTLVYDLSGSAVDVVDGFLGLDLPTISRSSYLAY